jgi:hypothetical protein
MTTIITKTSNAALTTTLDFIFTYSHMTLLVYNHSYGFLEHAFINVQLRLAL